VQVKLISYSKPSRQLVDEGLYDVQELVAFCARVSNPANQYNTETSEKLIKYLIKHAHWSPLEMASACLEIDTTRDIAHQIVRHRSFAFQEFSQRYADPKELGDMFTLRECRLQDTKNRQNSIHIDINSVEGLKLAQMWDTQQRKVIEAAKEAYEWAIKSGIAKEQARVVLPEGLTKTRVYMNGTIRSWIHYIQLRASNGTQLEHMEIAKACAVVIAEIFPLAAEFTQQG
jgi:thymidylate synthase (FAD)